MVGPPFGIRPNLQFLLMAQCLKITEKVSFNNASEASYVYILSGQKFLKNAKIEKCKCKCDIFKQCAFKKVTD